MPCTDSRICRDRLLSRKNSHVRWRCLCLGGGQRSKKQHARIEQNTRFALEWRDAAHSSHGLHRPVVVHPTVVATKLACVPWSSTTYPRSSKCVQSTTLQATWCLMRTPVRFQARLGRSVRANGLVTYNGLDVQYVLGHVGTLISGFAGSRCPLEFSMDCGTLGHRLRRASSCASPPRACPDLSRRGFSGPARSKPETLRCRHASCTSERHAHEFMVEEEIQQAMLSDMLAIPVTWFTSPWFHVALASRRRCDAEHHALCTQPSANVET